VPKQIAKRVNSLSLKTLTCSTSKNSGLPLGKPPEPIAQNLAFAKAVT